MKKRIIISQEKLTIKEAYESFIEEQEEKLRNGEIILKSLKNDKRMVQYFIDFVGADCLCNDIDKNTLTNYRNYQLNRVSSVTTKTYVRYAYIFLHYCMSPERQWIAYFQPIKVLAVKQKKVPLSKEELEIMLKKPNLKTATFADLRAWTALMIFANTAMRLKSAWSIKIRDLDFDRNIIHVMHNKNKIPYDVYMTEELKKALLLYLKYRGGELGDYLFCCADYSPISKDAFGSSIAKFQISRGVRSGTHIFRHTFATNLAMNGKGVFIKDALGHSTDAMAKEYISLCAEDISDVLKQYSPMASITQKKNRIRLHD